MSLRIKNLQHTYANNGRKIILIDSLVIGQGEQVLISSLGVTGKTTLLNILAGLLVPTAGQICFREWPMTSVSQMQRKLRTAVGKIGYIRQTPRLAPNLTIAENVEYQMSLAGVFPSDLFTPRALAMLGRLDLLDYAHHYPEQLDVGQQTQVDIVRALVNIPQLVLADQPTAHLNYDTSTKTLDFLQERCRQNSTTLVVTTNKPILAARFDRVYSLHNGQLEEISACTEQRAGLFFDRFLLSPVSKQVA